MEGLIRQWESERKGWLGKSVDGGRIAGRRLATLVAETLRFDSSRRLAFLNYVGLPHDPPRLVHDLIDSIEDGLLPFTITTDPIPAAAALWAVDIHEHEFFVPKALYPLSPQQALAIEARSDYRVDANAGFAHYEGPERFAVAWLAPPTLMNWAAQYLARPATVLARRLAANTDSDVYARAMTQLSRASTQGYIRSRHHTLRAVAPRELRAAQMA